MVRMITSAARARGQAASVISEHRRHPGGPLLLSAGICALHVPPFYARSLASLPVDRAGRPAHSGNLRWLVLVGSASPRLAGAVARCGCRRCGPVRPPAAGGLVLARGRPPPAATGSECQWQPEDPAPGPPLSGAILPMRGVLPSPSLGNGPSRRRRRCLPASLSKGRCHGGSAPPGLLVSRPNQVTTAQSKGPLSVAPRPLEGMRPERDRGEGPHG